MNGPLRTTAAAARFLLTMVLWLIAAPALAWLLIHGAGLILDRIGLPTH